jgi:hypothetical protein
MPPEDVALVELEKSIKENPLAGRVIADAAIYKRQKENNLCVPSRVLSLPRGPGWDGKATPMIT